MQTPHASRLATPQGAPLEDYILLTHEGRTLWLNNLSAKETVDLYSQANRHPYSLIVTTVSHDGVVGYLLFPGDE
jgi:hypothetical protein